MPQSLSAVYLHLVFSTKNREPSLKALLIREAMHAYLAGVSKKLDCASLIVGGTEDHVHLLCRFTRTLTLADWVKELKRASSLWIKTQEISLSDFSWQGGYGLFSVSKSHIGKTRDYIAGQEQHHQIQTFQDEFRAFLTKHQIEWDERYVWD